MLVGNIYAVWTWLNDIFSNIRTLTQALRNIPLRFVELEKYLDIIDKNPEFEENGKENFKNGNITFENVSFKYPKGEDAVIEDLNIEIPEGKKVAFVGFSGSGKSTIIKLLLRVYDWKDGNIKIGGISLRDMDAKKLRKNIGYVEQHVDLFDSTIKENILFGLEDKNVKKEHLEEVVHKARIDQFFHRLGEKGLETMIGERGVKLSGGERQRIGIARALIKNPEVLIFDEATASLDTENEKYIQEAIDESSKGRTTIIIAHRLSTVQNADIIFVMDKGKIVGEGTHNELKENCEEYQRLIKAQEH
jgi:ABC-type multidrug transport system fused ATPase/permease subunit